MIPAKTLRNVQQEEKIKLPGAHCFADGEIVRSGCLGYRSARLPPIAGRQPCGGFAQELRRKHNDNKVHDTESPKRRGNTVMDDFPRRDGTHDQRAKTVAANDAGHQTAPVGEPLHQRTGITRYTMPRVESVAGIP